MPKRSKGRAGNTIPDAAKKLRMGPGQLRRAIDNGEVNYVEFAGLKQSLTRKSSGLRPFSDCR